MSFYVEFNPPRLNIDTGTQIARGGGSGGEISNSLKEALLQMAEKVAYIDANGQDYYQDLYDALYPIVADYTISNVLINVVNSNTSSTISPGESYTATLFCAQNYEITSVTITMGGNDVTGTSYSSGTISIPNVTGNIVITAVATQRTATLSSITAIFTQGQNVIYDTDSLDTLKQYLVVTANWSDSTTSTVPSTDYTLSGTLTAGTSTITVSYGGKSDTFSVTVTEKGYVTDGLIMWLDGEKNGVSGAHETTLTTWVDQSGNGWDWTNASGTAAASVNAKSLSFNGSSTYLYRSYQSLPSNVAYMEIVIKGTVYNTNGNVIIAGFGRNKIGNINLGASKLTFHTGTGNARSSNTAFNLAQSDNNVVMAFNSAGYRNGVAETITDSGADWQYEYPSIGRYLGQSGSGNEFQFNGEIYCIRLYSRVLTESEILSNYAVDAKRFSIGG